MTDLPESYEGIEIYEQGGGVTNEFTGQSMYLEPVELSVYDYMMGVYYMHTQTGNMDMYQEFLEGKNWFIENNPEAYYTLID